MPVSCDVQRRAETLAKFRETVNPFAALRKLKQCACFCQHFDKHLMCWASACAMWASVLFYAWSVVAHMAVFERFSMAVGTVVTIPLTALWHLVACHVYVNNNPANNMIWFYWSLFWLLYGGLFSTFYPLTYLSRGANSWLFLLSVLVGLPATWLMAAHSFFCFLLWQNHPDLEDEDGAMALTAPPPGGNQQEGYTAVHAGAAPEGFVAGGGDIGVSVDQGAEEVAV